MNKHFLTLTALLALSLALTACGKDPADTQMTPGNPTADIGETAQTSPAEPSEEEQIPGTAEDAATLPGEEETPTVSDRPLQGEMTVVVEGEEETISTALYVGHGWSIYIPQTDWNYETQGNTRRWRSALNALVQMEVRRLEDAADAEAGRQALRESIQADWVEDKQGGMFCETEIGLVLEARVYVQDGGGVLALLYQYPTEAAEGFGVRLGAIADTFQVET